MPEPVELTTLPHPELVKLIVQAFSTIDALRARVAFLEGESKKDLDCLRTQAEKLARVDRLIARAEVYCLNPQAVAFLRGCID